VSTLDIAASLQSAGARDEALGEYVPARRTFGIPRPARIVPVGRAWRLGDLLLTPSGDVFRVGEVTRAITPKDFNSDKTIAGEARRELQRAAIRGGIAEGDTVNHGFSPLATPTDEVALKERAALLIDPLG
jgi:hypothetical protein